MAFSLLLGSLRHKGRMELGKRAGNPPDRLFETLDRFIFFSECVLSAFGSRPRAWLSPHIDGATIAPANIVSGRYVAC